MGLKSGKDKLFCLHLQWISSSSDPSHLLSSRAKRQQIAIIIK